MDDRIGYVEKEEEFDLGILVVDILVVYSNV